MNSKIRKIPFYPIVLFLRLAAQNGGINFKKIPIFAVYILRFVLLEPFRLTELFIYDQSIRSHVMKNPPIFILGHWRSGTSYLQNLLCQDPDTTSISIFKFLFADNYIITELWLKKPLNFLCKVFNIQYSFQRIPMDLNIMGEMDVALCGMCSENSYTWGHLFPKYFELWVDKLITNQGKETSQAWIEEYDFVIRKLSFHAKNKRVIVKSPGDTARLTILIQKYKNAKFIYIHRNPIDVYHSTKYLWGVILKENSMQTLTDDQVHRFIQNTYSKLLANYLDQRNVVPPTQLVELRFEDLCHNPLIEIKKIYSKLGLGALPQEELSTFIASTKSFKANRYPASLTLDSELKKKWAFSFKEWPI